jgi:hypothetical protein
MPPLARLPDTQDMEANRVVVSIGDPALARVLVLWLRDALKGRLVIASGEDPRPGDVVLATPADCDPVAAAELSARGVHPIILTPIPRRDDVARYARAGAAYLVMSIDNDGTLEQAVLSALGRQSSPPAIAPRAPLSHLASPRSA